MECHQPWWYIYLYLHHPRILKKIALYMNTKPPKCILFGFQAYQTSITRTWCDSIAHWDEQLTFDLHIVGQKFLIKSSNTNEKSMEMHFGNKILITNSLSNLVSRIIEKKYRTVT